MNKVYKKYVDHVLRMIPYKGGIKKRIRSDLYEMLEEKSRELGEKDPYILLGKPEELAEEFLENMEDKKNYMGVHQILMDSSYGDEYKSEKTLFGIPLVHINKKPLGVAKGIIAVGPLAIGVLSIGICSIGLFSLGVLSLGLLIALGAVSLGGILSLGGIAIGGLFVFGGVAISGYMAMGGYASAGELAIGGYAKARIAIGDVIDAHVGLYETRGSGEYVIPITEQAETMKAYIAQHAPDANGVVKFFIEKIINGLANGTTHLN